MNKDIRIAVNFFRHHKTVKLRRKLGAEAVLCLQQLWCYAAENKPKGALTGMNSEDISIAAGWEGDEQEFVSTLCRIGFLEECDEGIYHIHDWERHNPYAAHADDRSAIARKAAEARWGKRKEVKNVQDAYGTHADRMQGEQKGNAPSPSPSPSPSPKNEGSAEPTPKRYVFEIKTQGKVLNITENQVQVWQEKNRFTDVRAELARLSDWAEQAPKNKRWKDNKSAFMATANALANKNQKCLKDIKKQDPGFDPEDPDGSKAAEEAKARTGKLLDTIGRLDR